MSTRYNTGNPIESTDVRDMSDNAKNFDYFSLSSCYTFKDRFGTERLTIEGAIDMSGFKPGDGDFVTGFTVMPGMRNIGWYNPTPTGDNNWYSYTGEIPSFGYVVAPGTNPISSAYWKPVTDLILRDVVMFEVSTSDIATANLPIGSRVLITDRSLGVFEIVAGGTANGIDILSAGGGNTAVLSKDQKIFAEHLGVVAGSFSAANKVAVVNAIIYSSINRIPVHFKNARYPAWNYIIDVPGAEVVGAGMPNYKDDLSGLVDGTGTIFDGRVMFRGNDITLTGFGADAGLASTTAIVQDAIVVIGNTGTTIEASVTNHKYRDLIGVVASPDSAFHCILLQGINHLEFDNLVAVNGLFGVVIKCQNVIGGKIIGVTQGDTSCYIKGDTGPIAGDTYGIVENVVIDDIIYTGNGLNNAVSACKIHANSAKVSNVSIGNVVSMGGGYALSLQASADTTQMVGVNIGSVQGRLNYQEVVIDAINPDSIYGVNIGQVTTCNPRRGVIVESKTEHVANAHIGSIVGTNTGTKDIANIDIALKGDISVESVSVSSSNAMPTVAVTTLHRQKVIESNIPLLYETNLTLLNGHVNIDPANPLRLIHEADGFRFAGRIKSVDATNQLICNLPTILSCKEKFVAVPYLDADFTLKNAYIQINGIAVSVYQPDPSYIRWMDMSSISVNFKGGLN